MITTPDRLLGRQRFHPSRLTLFQPNPLPSVCSTRRSRDAVTAGSVEVDRPTQNVAVIEVTSATSFFFVAVAGGRFSSVSSRSTDNCNRPDSFAPAPTENV